MTKEEITAQLRWHPDYPWQATLETHSALFEQPVTIEILTAADGIISTRTAEIINQLLTLEAPALSQIKQFVWEDFLLSCERIDYGFPGQPNETTEQTNRREFDVPNADEAYSKSKLAGMLIDEEDQELTANYGTIRFDNDWTSHFCVIVVKDGQPVGYGEDGLYLGQFE